MGEARLHIAQGHPNGATMDSDDRAVELYRLEYEKAAERYENVYRSMWTIFSYLAAVAAGLLTFGSNRIDPHALVCVAASPLLFWFWTTYLPLDRYGNQTLRRLGAIEEDLNGRYGVQLDHFKTDAHELSVVAGLWRALSKRPLSSAAKDFWAQIHRARFAIIGFFFVLHLVTLYELSAFCRSDRPFFRSATDSSAPRVLVSVDRHHIFVWGHAGGFNAP